MKLGLRKILEAWARLCNWVNTVLGSKEVHVAQGCVASCLPSPALCTPSPHQHPPPRCPWTLWVVCLVLKKISPDKKWNLNRLRYSWPELTHNVIPPLGCVDSEGLQSLAWGSWLWRWNSGLHQHSHMTREGERVINNWWPAHLHLLSLKAILHAGLGAGRLRALQKLVSRIEYSALATSFLHWLRVCFPQGWHG